MLSQVLKAASSEVLQTKVISLTVCYILNTQYSVQSTASLARLPQEKTQEQVFPHNRFTNVHCKLYNVHSHASEQVVVIQCSICRERRSVSYCMWLFYSNGSLIFVIIQFKFGYSDSKRVSL